jgi:hypothetical protein
MRNNWRSKPCCDRIGVIGRASVSVLGMNGETYSDREWTLSARTVGRSACNFWLTAVLAGMLGRSSRNCIGEAVCAD